MGRSAPALTPALSPRAAAAIARRFPSYRDFVDAALFAPGWGYYSSGAIRFGDGGHYDTYPLALAPLFGRMVAVRAFQWWQRCDRPRRFEVCELGAGNGQLCLDVLLAVEQRADKQAEWRRFAESMAVRIVERSPALVARQRTKLGPLSSRVRWTCADLSTSRAPRPFGDAGFVIANEVLDCLAHHKVVRHRDGEPTVAFVVPEVREGSGTRSLPLASLGRVLANPLRRRRVRFREIDLPLDAVRGLRPFLQLYVPEIFEARHGPAYFAALELPRLIANTGRLYRRSQMGWIDYGDLRPFHLRSPEKKRVFAGPPRSGRTVFQAPGKDDITFMVDFSLAMDAARNAGLRVVDYGPQRRLRIGTGVRLDAVAVDLIVRYRLLGWLVGLVGKEPERDWRQGSLSFDPALAAGGGLRAGVRRDVGAFLGRRPSTFQLLLLES